MNTDFNNKSLLQILSEMKYFSKLQYEELLYIVRVSNVRTHRKERVIYYQGDKAEYIYLIIAGEVRQIKWREDETSILLGKYQAGSFLGLSEVISKKTYLVDTITEMESNILSIHITDFLSLLNILELRDMVIKELADSYYHLHNQLEVNTPLHRIVRYIKTMIETFETKNTYSDNYVINTTQENIAEAIGVTRETVNKYLKQLQDKGLISILRGKIEVENPEGLNKIFF